MVVLLGEIVVVAAVPSEATNSLLAAGVGLIVLLAGARSVVGLVVGVAVVVVPSNLSELLVGRGWPTVCCLANVVLTLLETRVSGAFVESLLSVVAEVVVVVVAVASVVVVGAAVVVVVVCGDGVGLKGGIRVLLLLLLIGVVSGTLGALVELKLIGCAEACEAVLALVTLVALNSAGQMVMPTSGRTVDVLALDTSGAMTLAALRGVVVGGCVEMVVDVGARVVALSVLLGANSPV